MNKERRHGGLIDKHFLFKLFITITFLLLIFWLFNLSIIVNNPNFRACMGLN